MKLFNEGKLLRYLGYAVGEIALIIIGIMLALQLNNWNEDRKAQVELGECIVQLKVDIEQAISVSTQRVEVAELRAEQAMTILRVIRSPKINQEDRELFETALEMVDQYHFPKVGLGHLGQIIDGNLQGLQEDKELSLQILEITKPLGDRLSILGELEELSDHGRETIVNYRGKAHPSYPDMKLAYDLDSLAASREFQYLAQQFVFIYANAQIHYERTIEILGNFLTVLEEYD